MNASHQISVSDDTISVAAAVTLQTRPLFTFVEPVGLEENLWSVNYVWAEH